MRGTRVDQRPYIGDFAGQSLLVETSIRDITVEGIERAETISGIRRTQILLHLPDHAPPRHHKGFVNLAHEIDALVAIGRHMPREDGERVEPHREIMKILPVA